MTRPMPSEVLEVTGLSLDPATVDGYIDDALLLIEPCSRGWSQDRERAVLKWVAAHLIYSTNDYAVIESEKLGDASETYARPSMGEGLMGTSYGQQAVLLSDCLKRLSNSKASIQVI